MNVIRWTIGPVSNEGFSCLRLAVKSIKKLYGNTCHYVICHNGLSAYQKSLLPDVDSILDQKLFSHILPIAPPILTGLPAWKLYPPRLFIESHEIMMDNDVVIYRKPKLFDEFFEKKDLIVATQGYGVYSSILKKSIPKNFHVNSGVLCFPPNFNFESILSNLIISHKLKWDNNFDEQTLVSYAIWSSSIKVKILSMSEIHICVGKYLKGNCGQHFVGLNNENKSHWNRFMREQLL